MYDCKAYVIDYHAKENDKMTKRTWIDTLVNYEIKNQWRIYDEKSIFIRRDVDFNEAKMTYKSFVEKSEFLLDSLYLEYKNDDLFWSVKNEDDQLIKIDQSVKENQSLQDENSESENSKNSDQEDDLSEIILSADSVIEMQSVRENLILSSTDSSQSVIIDQIASLHAAENTLVVSADQDDDDELSVLMSDSKSNDQTDNHLIFDENNSLILNYSRSKIRHDYKQLHHRNFVKVAKQIESIKSIVDHDLIISKTFE